MTEIVLAETTERVHRTVNDEWPEMASPEAVAFLNEIVGNIKNELRRAMLFGKAG